LADAVGIQVGIAENAIPAFAATMDTPSLNLLEGSRAGLLKMGNQPFEFSKGRFVPMNARHSDMPTRKPDEKFSLPWLDKLIAHFGGKQFALTREGMMRPVAAFGVLALLAMANMYLLTGPAEQRLTDAAFSYGGAAEASVAAIKVGGEGSAQERAQSALWADNLLAVGQSLQPTMKLERLELAPAPGKNGAGADLNLAITGVFPSASPANLKSVAVFIDQLSKDKSFPSIAQCASPAPEKPRPGARDELHVAALSGGCAMKEGLFKSVLAGSSCCLGSAQFFIMSYVTPRARPHRTCRR
jgi:hypothetical protein